MLCTQSRDGSQIRCRVQPLLQAITMSLDGNYIDRNKAAPEGFGEEDEEDDEEDDDVVVVKKRN